MKLLYFEAYPQIVSTILTSLFRFSIMDRAILAQILRTTVWASFMWGGGRRIARGDFCALSNIR